MEKEMGTVIEIRGDRVLVESQTNVNCESCGARHSCIMISSEKKRQLWIPNSIGATISDRVYFYVETRNVILASLLLYLLPVVLLIVGCIAGYMLSSVFAIDFDVSTGIGGVIGLIIYVIVLKLFSSTFGKRQTFYPKLVEII